MDKKKTVKISALILGLIIVLLAGIIGVKAYIRHRNLAETGNILGVEWYNQTDTQFSISTVEQLYELADLSDFYNFKGQTIKLDADIVVNEGNAEAWAKKAPAKRWNPITGFAGTFDGQNHTISGLYGKGFERRMALFADTEMSCTVKNLSLVNSYFETTGHRGTASIVSHGGGKFQKIYSDVIIVHKGENVGGIASTIDEQATFEECWFDGSISITNRDCGGIVDEVLGARVTVKHCLFSGYIYSSYDVGGTRTGGIFGRIDKNATIVLNDSLSSGTIECEKTVYTGSMLGASYNGVQFTIADTYVSSETYASAIGESGKKGSFTGTPLQMSASELTGVKAYQWTTLNFDSYWAVVEDDTPILKHFAKTVPSLEGVKKVYDTSWYMQGGYDFTIMTKEQLYGFYIISASTDYQDCKVKLGADIVVNEGEASKWSKKAPEMPWFPIATFAGQFDGQGHTISGLYSKASNSYVGLFGQATATSLIQNVNLKNCYFEKTGTSAAFMGSVAGDTYGIVKNVYSDAIIVSKGNQVGGIVGRLNDNDKTMSNMRIDGEDYSLMSNCWFDGSITMLAWEEENTGACEAGGLVGRVVQGDAIIEHCLNSGTVSSEVTGRALMVGGLVGYVVNAGELRITDCLNVGEIKTDYGVCVGSILGRGNTKERVVTVKNTYATTESYKKAISTNSLKASIKGDVICVDKSWIEGEKGYQFTTLDFGTYWTIVVGPDKTPILSQFASAKPSVKGLTKMVDFSWYKSDAKVMVIDSVADLYGFAMLSKTNDFEGKTIKLASDINVNSVDAATLVAWENGTKAPQNRWMTIGSSSKPFAGTFNGQGHTIRGVYSVTDQKYNGLFGVTAPTSMIRNLSLKDSYFAYNGKNLTEEGKEAVAYMGSIAGDLRGDMDSVYSNAIVTSTANQVGGLVGRANGAKDADGKLTTCTIRNCWFDGKVKLTSKTARYAGGIAAIAVQGTIEITNCLNTGSISNERPGPEGGEFLGGILGTEWTACTVKIDKCLNTGLISSKNINVIGSIVARIQKSGSKFTISDTYAMKGSCTKDGKTDVAVWSNHKEATVTGKPVFILESELLGVEAYKWTNLDFDSKTGYWSTRVNKTPILRSFNKADSESVVEGVILPDTSWYDANAKKLYISNEDQLYGLAKLVKHGKSFADQVVYLKKDLDLNPTWKDGDEKAPANVWLPIGNTDYKFQGTFDGQNHEIKGIYVTGNSTYLGLFGYVDGEDAKIRNLRLTNSRVEHTGETVFVGGIVGYLSKGTISGVYCSATVKSNGAEFGGIAGRAEGLVEECWFDGEVIADRTDATYVKAAGIVGTSWSQTGSGKAFTPLTIRNCLNTGSITYKVVATSGTGAGLGGIYGGDRGYTKLIVEDCVNTGLVDTNQKNGTGSIVGNISQNTEIDSVKTYSIADIKNCYGATNTLVTRTDGRIFGYNNANCTVTQTGNATRDIELMKDYVVYKKVTDDGLALDYTVWVARKEDVPVPRCFVGTVVEKSETVENPSGLLSADTSWYDKNATDLYIESEEELLGFAKLVNNGTTFKNQIVHLEKDMDLNPEWNIDGENAPINKWIPIGNADARFAGTFDGHKCKISGVYVNATGSYVGLFGATAEGAVIKNLILTEDCYLATTDTNYAYLGSVVGELRGRLDTVYSKATVESTVPRVGGLVGMVNQTADAVDADIDVVINNCWFDGIVNLKTQNGQYAGGIVGFVMQNNVTISNSLNTGLLTCEANDVGLHLGGILGSDNNIATTNVLIENCLSAGPTMETLTNSCVGVIIGRTKANTTYTIINTYGANESYTSAGNTPKAIGNQAGTVTIQENVLMEKTNLQGTEAYKKTLLDFYINDRDSGAWVARDKEVPALKAFVGTNILSDDDVVNLLGVGQNEWYDEDVNTYYIGSVSAFKAFRDYVNDGKTFDGKTIYLTDDIDLNPGWTAPENTSAAVIGNPEEWIPIGGAKKFKGTFDGQKHTIRGVYVNKSNEDYVALFGGADGATICNLNIINSYFKQSGTNQHWTGSLVGLMTNGGTISGIYSNAIIISQGRQIGGIVGRAEATIEQCWYQGELKATRGSTAIFAGGIVGASHKSGDLVVQNCLSEGKIICNYNPNSESVVSVGGIYGGTYDATPNIKIQDCIFGNVIEVKSKAVVGAVAGLINKAATKYEINNCYVRTDAISNKTETTISSILGGTANDPQGVVRNCVVKAITAMRGVDVYNDLVEGGLNLDYQVWVARKEDTPVPRCFVGTVVDKNAIAEDKTGRVYADATWLEDNAGTESDPYQLNSAGDLLGFANEVNAGNDFQGKYIKLTADIDYNPGWTVTLDKTTGKLSGKAPRNVWLPIGGASTSVFFNGTFDGDGHTIRGIYINTKASEYKGFAGLFGYAMAASTIKNFQLVNSYIESGNANTGSIVGRFGGTMNNVYSNATVFGVGTTGGLVGLYTEGGNKTIQKCWFDGSVTAEGSVTYCGGIVACTDKKDKTKTVKNCLNTGKVTCEYDGDNNNVATSTGGIVGGNKSGTLKVENCLNLGAVSTPKDVNRTNKNKGTAAIVGYNAKDHSVTVQDSYYTNSEWNAVGFNNKGTVTLKLNGNTVTSLTSNTVAELTGAKAAQNAPYLGISDSGAWTTLKVQENNQVKEMTPILKDFKAWWLDEHNYTKNLLMIGNSFSYYYVEELYGIAEAAGVHLNIYNVYKSGCTLGEHWDWLQSDEKNYDFYVTNADGRRKALSGKVGLKDCLAVADWDIISLQQASTTYIDTVETAKALTEPYAQNLYGYLREKFPNARYLWHQTWSSQIGYQHATDANNKVQDREAQKLRDANAVGLASYICQTYNVENVPSGSAWDIARKNALIGDTLCNRVNSSGVDDTDNHHDGNVGGGQYLNACVWFETLTGKSCVGNTYRPDDYDISEDKIAVLQQSAHEAVKAIYGETE